ncbi:MAG: secretin N-terminal domain-containing protein [Planctomycetota bacterium]
MNTKELDRTTLAALLASAALAAGACRGPSPLHHRQVTGDTIPARRDTRALLDLDRESLAAAAGEAPLAAAVPSPPEAPAPPPRIGDDTPRQLDLRGVPLSEAVHLIAAMAGVNVYLDADLGQPVDASFPAVTLDDALAILLARNGLALVEDPPGIFWVAPDDESQPAAATFQLQSINGEDVLANLQGLLSDDTALVVDRNQNLVIVRGSRADVEAARAYLAEADRLKRQVLIEVEILEIILDDEYSFGLRHVLSDPDFLGESTLEIDQDLSTGAEAFTATLDLHGYSLSSTIDALSSYGIVRVLSSPRVMAITNTQATIQVVTEIPYIETSTSIQGGGAGQVGTTSQTSVAFKEAGIKLEVTPVVQAGGVVQLAVNQELSEVVDFFLGVPVLDKRTVVNQFLVNGTETAVIGGLMQDRVSEVDEGVPVLMHVPLLGRLFRNDHDETQKRELLILITPRELDPSAAAALAGQYESQFEARSRAGGFADPRSR